MQVNLQLMILSISHTTTRTLQLILSEKRFPSVVLLQDNEILPLLKGLIEEHIEIHANVYNPKLLDVVKDGDEINIIYGIMVPDFIKIKLGGWNVIEEIMKDDEVQRYIQYVHKIT